ncbi:MAG TPA: cyclic pyranopterin monophosphate synthase MoaC [Chloroflexi bacterium]|jgi:cyclic pyranopterin phosphate synthase|nr:cyclic pyranopterin monophosphate synthase MoaC [Chloroflexota bacterium]HBV94485.1 cyclic pyranopterin monophosphate synthase MoaC [Chloroflexota bacterium]
MNRSRSDAVRVLCFGALRERLGAEILVREKVTTVLDLWSMVARDHPDLRDPRGRVRAARNLAYCDWQTPVEPGDEVAFMPPVTGGSTSEDAGPRLHVALVTDPIDLTRLVAEVRGDGDGAIAAFIGAVRGTSQGSPVHRLDYETYLPMADRELRRIGTDVTERHGLSGIALVHRVGSLLVGEVSVAVAAAAPHRRAALLACAEAVESLKRDLPVWKREHHPDGARWVSAGDVGGASQPHAAASLVGPGRPGTEANADALGGEPMAAPALDLLSHLGPSGSFRMVDVSDRPPTLRAAKAEAMVHFGDPATLAVLRHGAPKGDVLAAARLAGIMGAKRTPELIPLCHPLPLTHLDVQVTVEELPPGVRIVSFARCAASTGVEMEALTAATVAALTVLDMLKSADPWMTIDSVRLLSKSGGRSGDVQRPR